MRIWLPGRLVVRSYADDRFLPIVKYRNAFALLRESIELLLAIGTVHGALAAIAEPQAQGAGNGFELIPTLVTAVFEFAVADIAHASSSPWGLAS